MPILESSKPHATLICVGSELLRGKINTHASTIARRLASIGLELSAEHTIGDEEEALARLIGQALESSSLVIVTGGLGPTFDDLTREAAAQACGRRLILSKTLLAGIQRKFRRAKYRHMPPANQRQAYLIEGARAIQNPVGTAPGQWLDIRSSSPAVSGRGSMGSPPVAAGNDERQVLILLPGPPSELNPMLEASVLPGLKKSFPALPTAEAHLHFVGVPESIVDDKIRPIIAKEKDVQFTILAHLGLVDFDIFVTAPSRRKADERLARIVRKIRKVMGGAFYGMNEDYPLEKVVGDQFRRRRATLAVAESCTGGMLAAKLTDIPGSSDFFLESVVTYANAAKEKELDVPRGVIEACGAVSNTTAEWMAKGIRKRAGSSVGLAITGIAGPGGGSSKKPVGLIYISVSADRDTRCQEFRFTGSRDAIRQRAVISALDLLRQIYL